MKMKNVTLFFCAFLAVMILMFTNCKKDSSDDVVPSSNETTQTDDSSKTSNTQNTTSGSDDTNSVNNTTIPTSVTDADGNTYATVVIGDQVWLAENLKATKYNDGTDIPKIENSDEWVKDSTGAYCVYDNDENNAETYGKLYNWYAVSGGKLCPSGWHVSTDDDWIKLTRYLSENGYAYDGTNRDGTETNFQATEKVAKSIASTSGWDKSDKKGAVGNDLSLNNKSGFTGVPNGYRNDMGSFGRGGYYAYWWTNTVLEDDSTVVYTYNISNNFSGLLQGNSYKYKGYAVRCVRD